MPHEPYESFGAWADEKQELENELAAKKAEEAAEAAARAAEKQRKADAAFARWVVDKRVHDEALALLPRLGPLGSGDEDWAAVLAGYAYTHCYLSDQHTLFAVDVSENPKRSLEHVFAGFTRKFHGFDKVSISASLAAKLSPEARAGLEDAGGGAFYLSGLSYAYAPPGARTPPDDRLRNGIFSSAVKKAWAAAVAAAAQALDAEAGSMAAAAPARCALAHRRGISALHGLVAALESRTAADAASKAAERAGEGRKYHAAWLARKDAVAIRLPPPSAFDDAPRSAPPSLFAADGPPRMLTTYKAGAVSFRVAPPAAKPALRSSAEILEGMGSRTLRQAHAIGEGAASKDLAASRAYLLSKGAVLLANFASAEEGGVVTAEGREAYARAVAEAARAGEAARAARAASERAFEAWCMGKEASALARECMQLMPCTLGFDKGEGGGEAAEAAAADAAAAAAAAATAAAGGSDTGAPHAAAPPRRRGSSAAAAHAAPLRPATEDERALWHAVGYACRCVNRSLLEDWVAWSGALFTGAQCWGAWRGFAPPPGAEGAGAAAAAASAVDAAAGGGGGGGGATAAAAAAAAAEAEASRNWGPGACKAALGLLHELSREHRRLAALRTAAAGEAPPVLPMLRRCAEAEALPRYLHGAEGAISRVNSDLGIAEGAGCSTLGGAGVGAELVLQWWVGEEPAGGSGGSGSARRAGAAASPAPAAPAGAAGSGSHPEPAEALLARLGRAAAARAAARQPPYVIVLESVGISGGARSREGGWARVAVDPPLPLPLLTSAPGSSFTPVSPLAQGLCVLPPSAGREWAGEAGEGTLPPTTLRGAIRLTGLRPNTCYAFRVRAFSRAGAGPYAFGAFTTAPAPPPAPLPALPSYVPRGILASDGAAALVAGAFPVQPDALTLVWDRGVDLRVGLLRLMRLFAAAVAGAGGSAAGAATAPRARAAPRMDADGIMDYGDEGGEEWGEGGGGGGGGFGGGEGGLFDEGTLAPRTALLDAIRGEEGMRLWLRSCLASVDYWRVGEEEGGGGGEGAVPGRPLYLVVAEAEMEGGGEGGSSAFRKVPARTRVAQARPCDVLEALVKDLRSGLSWGDVCGLFSLDGDGRSASDVLLAGTELPPPPPPADATLPPPPGEALALAPSTATALAAIARSGGGSAAPSRPGSARSARSGSEGGGGEAAGSGSARKGFNPVGGVFSEQSIKNSSLRAAQTKLTRTFLDKHGGAAAGGGSGEGSSSSSGGGGGATSRPGSASTSSPRLSRPASASSLTRAATRGAAPPASPLRRGAPAASPSAGAAEAPDGAPAAAAPASAATAATTTTPSALRLTSARPIAEVSQRYSLLQCVSDGALGQEWSEVYLGVRAVRCVDKLLPGTAYAFKVQAVNADGVGSLMSPAGYVTTALPAPGALRAVGLVSATAVTLAWAPVSAANALSTARALGKPAGGGEAGGEADKGADIDAVFEALLAKSKGTAGGGSVAGAGAPLTLKSAAAAVPVREGDGGYGVSLLRPWSRYDAAGAGRIPVAALRGLLADLGAYSETCALVGGAGDANEGVASSGEGAAQVGAGAWRLAAATAALDPKGTGWVAFGDFSDWWNAIDAALEKAASLNSAPGTPSRTPSRAGSAAASRPSTAAPAPLRSVLGAGTGVAGAAEDLTAAVLYVLECRRSVPREEVAAAAAVVADVARGGAGAGAGAGAASGSGPATPAPAPSPRRPASARSSATAAPSPRPSSARASLASPLAATLAASAAHAAGDAAGAVAEAAALCQHSHTPWAVVYMGSAPRFRLAGLLPNGHYHFRVTALGRHAFSSPSRALAVHLPPLAPFAPVAVRLGPRGAALRWYPGALGADKYELQCKIVEALAPPGGCASGGASARRENDGSVFCGRNVSEAALRAVLCSGEGLAVAAGGVGGGARGGAAMWDEDCDIAGGLGREREGGWAALYTGMSTFTSVTGLLANTVYRFRVVAFSSAGMPSRPSHETQLVTLDSAAHQALAPASASRDFSLLCRPCAGGEEAGAEAAGASPGAPATLARLQAAGAGAMQDIVVGDTIVWTEDVCIDGARALDPYHPAPPREVEPGAACATRRYLTSRTIAAVVLADSASRLGAASGSSANVGGEAGPMPVGAMQAALTLVGKMPASPRVMGREEGGGGAGARAAAAASSGSLEEALAVRTLALQVEWCTVGLAPGATPARHLRASHGADALAAAHPEQYVKGVGSNLQRSAAALAALDVFRVPWRDEEGRWSLVEELGASYDS